MLNRKNVTMNIGLFCAGQPVYGQFIDDYIKDCDYMIAVDNGIKYLFERKIRPDLIIGDFDSMIGKYSEFDDIERIVLDVDKDFTDTEAAIFHLQNTGYNKIYLFNALKGNRFDHSLFCTFLLNKYKNIEIIDSTNKLFVIDDYLKFSSKFKYISFVSLENNTQIEYSHGLKYDISHHVINSYNTKYISNEIIDDYIEIKIKSGKIMVVLSKD